MLSNHISHLNISKPFNLRIITLLQKYRLVKQLYELRLTLSWSTLWQAYGKLQALLENVWTLFLIIKETRWLCFDSTDTLLYRVDSSEYNKCDIIGYSCFWSGGPEMWSACDLGNLHQVPLGKGWKQALGLLSVSAFLHLWNDKTMAENVSLGFWRTCKQEHVAIHCYSTIEMMVFSKVPLRHFV